MAFDPVFIGLVAGTILMIAPVIQIAKIIKLKETKEISLTFLLLSIAGISLWLTYGIIVADNALIISNSAGIIIFCIVTFLKIKYG